MKYLLDTHVLLWYLSKDPNLSDKAKEIVDDRADLYFSIVSLWEIAIKVNIGKLQISRPIDALPIELQYIHTQLLPITTRDIEIYSGLPLSKKTSRSIRSHIDCPNNKLFIASSKSRRSV